MNPVTRQFPRELTVQEKSLLFSVLPEKKPGYNLYREKINRLMVTGYGRFKNNNYILGKENTFPDLSLPSAPVFAAGTVKFTGDEIDILINEEQDEEIEFDLSLKNSRDIPEYLTEIDKWSYSDWNPGDKSPFDNKEVREVVLHPAKYVLAFAASHGKIWLNDNESGVNYLIPLTNYFNELMRYKGIRDPGLALDPKSLFRKLNDYSDRELLSAFVMYNKYMRRFPTDFSRFLKEETGIKRKRRFKDLFRKDKN